MERGRRRQGSSEMKTLKYVIYYYISCAPPSRSPPLSALIHGCSGTTFDLTSVHDYGLSCTHLAQLQPPPRLVSQLTLTPATKTTLCKFHMEISTL